VAGVAGVGGVGGGGGGGGVSALERWEEGVQQVGAAPDLEQESEARRHAPSTSCILASGFPTFWSLLARADMRPLSLFTEDWTLDTHPSFLLSTPAAVCLASFLLVVVGCFPMLRARVWEGEGG
jgi:hypothetical protein